MSLIEGFFQQLPDKKYALIVLHSGRIYDLDDFKIELSSKFERIIIKDINENQNLTTAEWRALFESEIFDFSIGDIELSLNFAVPLEWDDNFEVSLDTSKRQFILKKSVSTNDKKVDIHLATRGMTKDADVEVKVNGLIYSGKVKNNTNFMAPQWKHLSSNDKHLFVMHLKEYKKSNFNVECPSCHKKHTFEKPFFCSEQSGDILLGQLTQGASILKDLSSCHKGFVLFRYDGKEIKYLTSEKEVLECEDLRFIFVSKNNNHPYDVKCGKDSLEIVEARKIHANLYELGEDRIVYLI